MKKIRKNKYIVLIVVLLAITLGYAYLQANLKLLGGSMFGVNWDIHFENARETEDSMVEAITPPSAPAQQKLKEIGFEVTFNQPGEMYEFLVDVKNGGSVEGIIEAYTRSIKINNKMKEIADDDSNLPSFIDFTITEADGSELETEYELGPGEKETIKVRIKLKGDISNDQLSEISDKTYEFEVGVHVRQKGSPQGTSYSKWDTNPLNDESIELVDGETYVDGQYTYTYIANIYDFDSKYDFMSGAIKFNEDGYETQYPEATPSVPIEGGWHVQLTSTDSYDPVTDKVRTSINGKPIISMYGAYAYSYAESIDFSNIYTGNMIDMRGMFYDSVVRTVDVSNFDTSNVISMNGMFSMSNLREIIGLDKFNTNSVRNMRDMFSGSEYLESIDVSSFNTSQTIDFMNMFYYTSSLSTIYGPERFETTSMGPDYCDANRQYSCDNGMFGLWYSLEGENGTRYDEEYEDGITFARRDKPGQKGYFTAK